VVWWRSISGTLAERYLVETRKLVLPPDITPDVLRFHHACWLDGQPRPCLLALFRNIHTNEPQAIMRTALTPDAKKIKRMALGPIGAAAIKITDNADVAEGLTIGEGLETTLAGMMLAYAPAWALGSAGGIEAFPAPPGIEALTILAETDDSGANARAIAECADRWAGAGHEVYRTEPLIGGDLNDTIMREA
jgi:putative DNA primase/helicase